MRLQIPIYIVAAMDLLFVALMIVHMSFKARMEYRLEICHREVWQKLGRPRFLSSEPYAAFISPYYVFGFIVGRKYLLLGDEQLNYLGNRAFVFLIAALILLCLLLFVPHHRFVGTNENTHWSIFI